MRDSHRNKEVHILKSYNQPKNFLEWIFQDQHSCLGIKEPMYQTNLSFHKKLHIYEIYLKAKIPATLFQISMSKSIP